MILQSLRELALREGLVDDPAFESKPVRWVIELDADGRFLYVHDTNSPEILTEGSKKKPRQEATLMVIPRRQVRSVGIRANFLVDNAKYVLGLKADAEAPSDPKNVDRHAEFLRLLQAAPREVSELRAVLDFLAMDSERAACAANLANQGGFVDNDLFTFKVDGVFLHQEETLRAHWAAPAVATAGGGELTQCLVCGEQCAPTKLHNQIQIRGASTSGVPLVSFNSSAFEKYGWIGSSNAPVCTACMTAYVEALRRLTRARYDDPKGKGLQPLSTVLNGDTTAVYWADLDSPFVSALPSLRDAPDRVQKLLQSPRAGQAYSLRPKDRFFCLILTGVQGRAIVRRMHAGTVADVERNLRRYFAAIDVGRFAADAPIPQFLLLKALVLNGELDSLSPELGTELWLSALFDLPLSRVFLAAIVTRNRVEQQELEKGKWKVGRERTALLQLYFTGHDKHFATGMPLYSVTGVKELPLMGLNESSKDRAYLFGRVLAVAERMQMLAQPQGLNRTLVDRFFGMASVRPKVVFAELMKLYKHHRMKAMRDIPYVARDVDQLWGELLFNLEVSPNNPDLDAFGKSFDLEQQGRFGLGYYHQRHKFWKDFQNAKEERARRANGESTGTEDIIPITEETPA